MYSSPYYTSVYKGSSLGPSGQRPSSLTLTPPVAEKGGGAGGGGVGSGGPNKTPRYTPVVPTLYSRPTYGQPDASSSYSNYGQRAQEVITVPPKSSLAAYRQQENHQGGDIARQNIGLSASTTKINTHQHNLIDSIPDVFCLSCPPAEFKFSDAYRAKTLPRTGKENERLIGFATLPEQVHRKSVKKGFDFTLMVVGESGLGKSTLINSLFLADFYQNRKIPSVEERVKKTTDIQKHTIEIEERGVKLRLTVVDTPGFGDSINCEESWKAAVDHIDDQFHLYFQAESGLNRRHIRDSRVHCCLYFLPPYGHGLRPLDVEALKNLQSRVNIIPVLAKADTLTSAEMKNLKEQIMEDLRRYQIQIYQFPECDEEEDEEFKRQYRDLKATLPFAVASSETFVEVAGKKVRGRQYPWGIVEVENPNHSDFCKLRTMLIQSHMHDLKETTQDLHYENFRAKAIAQISQGGVKEGEKLKRDSSTENSQDLLLQKEAEIKRMQQMISKMEAKLKEKTKPSRDSIIDL